MVIDRAATLRNAEKLLRQGRLEPAIIEYLRVVEDHPRDLNTANILGDLYVRVGQTDKAIEQFIRIADTLNEEGLVAKAAATYRKILKLKPDHEHALLQVAEIGASQGLYVDARAHLNTLIATRQARGDKRGAAQARIMLGSLDPADFAGRMDAAGARAEVGDTAGAVTDLKEIAAGFTETGQQPEAVDALRQAALLRPDDNSVRTQLFDVYVLAEDYTRAREAASTKEQCLWLAQTLERRGETAEALDALRDASRFDPNDAVLRARLARAFVARGDTATAAEYLTVETAGDDPALRLAVAEILLRSGKIDDGLAIAKRLLDDDPARRDQMAEVGCRIAEEAPEAGFEMMALAVETSLRAGDWAVAAAALQEFVTQAPNHIPALLRLIEICVDGGLEATMSSVQGQLADAYISVGMAAEARFIAEELVAREPYERANIDRFRRALVLLGEPEPDAVIAERLSGQSPFMSTALNAGDELPAFEPGPSTPSGEEATSGDRQFDLSAGAIDIKDIVAALESPYGTEPPTAHVSSDSVDLDLSLVLDDFEPPPEPDSRKEKPPPVVASDLDGAFAQLRDEAAQRSSLGGAQADYEQALALREQGDIEGCIKALVSASKAAALRFGTASMLGRIYKERGMMPQALEWLERAAQAPAPSPGEYHALLLELADVLETTGEVARALAVCLELQADAGSYRDVDARVGRLVRMQA